MYINAACSNCEKYLHKCCIDIAFRSTTQKNNIFKFFPHTEIEKKIASVLHLVPLY